MCYNIMQYIVEGDSALYKFGIKALAALAAAVLLCGCTEIAEEPPAPAEKTTAAERPYPVSVESLIFNEQPESAGSLSPAITEIICELGYSDKLIGRSSYCDYPESVSAKAGLGSAANPDIEAIIAAAPKLLVSYSPIAKKDITALENAGVRVWILPAPSSVEMLYRYYADISAVFGGKTGSEEAADNAMKPLIASLCTAEGSMDSFAYIMSPELAAASDSTFAGNFFSHFGENAVGDSEDISLSESELIQLDPQWIIIPHSVSAEELPTELDAVKKGRIIVLDKEMLERIERPTSRLDTVVYGVLEQIESIGGGDADGETEAAEER